MKNLLSLVSIWSVLIALSVTSNAVAENEYESIDVSPDLDTTSIHIYMNNKTGDTMKLSRPSEKQANGTVPIDAFDVPPKGKMDYVMDFPRQFNSIAFAKPAEVKQSFAFTSGRKECRFEVNIKVTLSKQGDIPKTTPQWSGMVESIGAVPADCSAEILQVIEDFPHSYSIEFSME
ncbi:hypothetical protein DKY63_07820 [Pseudomonas putida]|uniref:DUF4424 domain-containing protein n=1 Tax=Pseudomonas putida TaxID=303 RepID=A0A2Z4RF97_PSEPU|nr:hypothetical protein [Pseudomonas putida]AWY39811.1 hypothetical protein DKY63_07820 [Pseudomonas putida]